MESAKRDILDKKLLAVKKSAKGISSQTKWIKTIRSALGMTASQLAARLKISPARVSQIEEDESALSMKSMKKIASALECDFVPFFIPKTSLSDAVRKKAARKAKMLADLTNATMSLERQAIESSKELEKLQKMLMKQLEERGEKHIWE